MTKDEIDLQLQASRTRIQALDASTSQTEAPLGTQTWWSVTNAMTISTVVLGFGIVVLLLATNLIKVGRSSEDVLRIFGTILIILVSAFLVVAGYTSDQVAPVGLLGTIVGYLLGKGTPKTSSDSGAGPRT